MADIKDFRNKNTKFTGSDGIVLPVGNTSSRPSGITGETRYNSQTGSIEFYDGANWISTNLIPTVNSVTGSITNGLSSSITVNVSNGTDTLDVIYSEGGIELARNTGATNSGGNVTVSVPAAVYGQTAGDTIAISVANQDGTPSSNSVNITVGSPPSGGSISTSGGYRYHTFTSTANFVVPSGFSTTVEYLLVAGGGGGGTDDAGGAGAGGFLTGSTSVSAGNYLISIGGSGARGANGTSNGGNNGGNTTGFGATAIGGGGGGHQSSVTANSGGSGGGGGHAANPDGSGAPGASGTSGQGNNGGDGRGYGDPWAAGGGGGASQTGFAGVNGSGTSGNGGAGSSWNGFGPYAGGGGGQYRNQNRPGGSGGGGRGSNGVNTSAATDGSTNTGGGGGGGGNSNTSDLGGNGGSGIAIVRYAV